MPSEALRNNPSSSDSRLFERNRPHEENKEFKTFSQNADNLRNERQKRIQKYALFLRGEREIRENEIKAERLVKKEFLSESISERARVLYDLDIGNLDNPDQSSENDVEFSLDEELIDTAYYSDLESRSYYDFLTHNYASWKDDYNKSENQSVPFSLFISDKLLNDLEEGRKSLIEYRSIDFVMDFYTSVDGEELDNKRIEIVENTTSFFDKHKGYIDQKIAQNKLDFADMLGVFSREILNADYEKASFPQKVALNRYFYAVIDDYVQMIYKKQEIDSFLPLLINSMESDLSYDDWVVSIKKERERLSKINDKKKEVEKIITALQPTNKVLNVADSPELTRISQDSNISFVAQGNGRFEVVYGNDEANVRKPVFQISTQVDENGNEKTVYLIEDVFRDSNFVLASSENFERTLKSIYFDRIMNGVIQKGRHYMGSNLDSFLGDEKMEKIVEALFFPRKIESISLKELDNLSAFKNLVLLLTSDNNLSDNTNDYGNLKSIQRRISLLFHVLNESPTTADTMRRLLIGFSQEKIRKYTFSKFLKRDLRIANNFGNFSDF